MKREKKRLEIEKETLRNLSRDFNVLKKIIPQYTGKKLFWDIWTGNWNKFIYKTDKIIDGLKKNKRENSKQFTSLFINEWRPVIGDKIDGKRVFITE